MEECDVYGGNLVLTRTGSNEPVPDITPYWTSLEECGVDGGDSVLHRTGSHEPVPGGMPCWTGVKKCDIYEGDVVLRQAGSDHIVTNAVSTVDPGGPGHGTGSVTDVPGDVLVMPREDKGTLDIIHYEPPPPTVLYVTKGCWQFGCST